MMLHDLKTDLPKLFTDIPNHGRILPERFNGCLNILGLASEQWRQTRSWRPTAG